MKESQKVSGHVFKVEQNPLNTQNYWLISFVEFDNVMPNKDQHSESFTWLLHIYTLPRNRTERLRTFHQCQIDGGDICWIGYQIAEVHCLCAANVDILF